MIEPEDPSRDRLKHHFAQRVIHQARQTLEVWQRLQCSEWNAVEMAELSEANLLLLPNLDAANILFNVLKVTGGQTNEKLARLTIRESSTCRDWMRRHGVRFQPSLAGTLHLSRTNAFFMGGGKALVNAYYRSAQALGVQVRYIVDGTEISGP